MEESPSQVNKIGRRHPLLSFFFTTAPKRVDVSNEEAAILSIHSCIKTKQRTTR
jgi:hypothetical protein